MSGGRSRGQRNGLIVRLPPDQPENLAHHVAQGKQHGSPNERRTEIRGLELPPRHPENAGDQRNRGAQRPEKTADEDRKRPPALHERFALRQQFGMARQRPRVRDWWSKLEADPVGQPVTQRGPDRPGNPNRPEIEVAGADQDTDSNQRRPGRNEQGNECKRFAEGERKNNGRRPRLVDTHKLHHLLGVSFEALEHAGGGPVTSPGLARLARQDQTACRAILMFRLRLPLPDASPWTMSAWLQPSVSQPHPCRWRPPAFRCRLPRRGSWLLVDRPFRRHDRLRARRFPVSRRMCRTQPRLANPTASVGRRRPRVRERRRAAGAARRYRSCAGIARLPRARWACEATDIVPRFRDNLTARALAPEFRPRSA